jgi:hypothetical protein
VINSKILKNLLLMFTLALGAAALAAEQDVKSDVETGKRWLTLMNHKADKDNTISKKEFDTYINAQLMWTTPIMMERLTLRNWAI